MSYPQFNLTILQLPAPASNMTKAEYKAAYGIDLDEVNIKAFKLVLLGNEKYPIDQIKEIEDGYEIYFNGRILSITNIVQTSDEVYDVANSKPIYWHGLNIFNSTTKENVQAHILNNSPTPINTAAKLQAWMLSIEGTVFLQATGVVKVGESFRTATAIIKNASNEFTLLYIGDAGYAESSRQTELSSFTVINAIEDRLNKIN